MQGVRITNEPLLTTTTGRLYYQRTQEYQTKEHIYNNYMTLLLSSYNYTPTVVIILIIIFV